MGSQQRQILLPPVGPGQAGGRDIGVGGLRGLEKALLGRGRRSVGTKVFFAQSKGMSQWSCHQDLGGGTKLRFQLDDRFPAIGVGRANLRARLVRKNGGTVMETQW